jgi:hypothetical protein
MSISATNLLFYVNTTRKEVVFFDRKEEATTLTAERKEMIYV